MAKLFKKVNYKAICAEVVDDNPVWVEKEVFGLKLDGINVSHVLLEKDGSEWIEVDNVSVFVQESTTKFDKDGVQLFGGDIVSVPLSFDETGQKDCAVPILWINAGWHFFVEKVEQYILLDERNTRLMKKVGNMIQHASIVEKSAEEVEAEVIKKISESEKESDVDMTNTSFDDREEANQ